MMEKLINKIFKLVEGEEELTNAPVVAKDDGNCTLSLVMWHRVILEFLGKGS